MKSLYLRVWLTVVAVLALFALGSGWLVQRHMERERGRADALAAERVAAWADLIQRSLPGAEAPPEEQSEAVLDWSQRLRMPLALDDARGRRIVATATFERRMNSGESPSPRIFPIRFADGRTLWVMRPVLLRLPHGGEGLRVEGPRPDGLHPGRLQLEALRFRGLGLEEDFPLPPWFPFAPPGWGRGVGMIAVLALLFAASAWLRGENGVEPSALALALSFAGAALSLVTAWLGGELVDRLGVGVSPGAGLDAPSSLHGEVPPRRA